MTRESVLVASDGESGISNGDVYILSILYYTFLWCLHNANLLIGYFLRNCLEKICYRHLIKGDLLNKISNL